MLLITIILLGVTIIPFAIFVWMEIGITNDRLQWLEERLTKLEKDAVKVTFTPPFTTGDEKVIVHPQVKLKPNPKQFDGVKSEEPFVKTRTKRKPKTTKDWEDEFDLGGHE
jgi:hypothetical protein